MSQPQLRPRPKIPKLPSLGKSISRQRFRMKHSKSERQTPRVPPGDRPTTSTRPAGILPGTEEYRGTVITTPMRGSHSPAHSFEVPCVPQKPQEFQEFNDDDQEDEDLYDPFEPVPDDFAERFNEELFRERLVELLNRETEFKNQEPTVFREREFKATQIRGFPEPKRVHGESMRIERPTEESEMQVESEVSSQFNIPSTSGQSSTVSTTFGVQEIGDDQLSDQGKLGAGRSGQVYLAHWHGAEVAVKVFQSADPAEGERAMQQEIKNLSMLKHPSVVTLYGRCYINRTPAAKLPAIVLEYVPGGSLRSALHKLRQETGRRGALGLRSKLQIALQAAYAMKYLHFRNMIHFDVKAENFLCDLKDLTHPIIKAADVGLSKHKITSFVSGNMIGTLPWMAPELFPRMQRSGTIDILYTTPQVNNKVDVYSFGIMMWEIWTMGADPYRNMSANDLLYHIIGGYLRPRIPIDCNAYWSDLMQACWHAEPDERPSFLHIAMKLENMLKRV